MLPIHKKMVFVAGHTEQTCESFKRCIEEFLGDYISVVAQNLAHNPNLPTLFDSADLVLVATTEMRDSLNMNYPDKPILVGERVLGAHNLDKLLGFQNDTLVYVIGSTNETTSNTVNILENLGLDKFIFTKYFPGMPGPVDKGIKIAITPGLLNIVPEHVEQVINVGAKELAISAYADIISHLKLPIILLDKISNFYVKTILHNVRDMGIVARQNETLNNRLETIFNTIHESIISLDENCIVVAYNYVAEKIFRIPVEQAMGKNWNLVHQDSVLAQCIKTGVDATNVLKKINDEHYIVTAKTIFDAEKKIRGVVGTFKLVEEIKNLDTQVRRELRTKANVAKYTFQDIKGESSELKKAILLASKFANTELAILLEGESGTGKELFAQAIHNHSSRKNRPFLAINFAAIPDNLAESELFGYEDGAFTGARKGGKAGLFEEAHLGTIFLDEIGSASPDVQNRLLRVLEEYEIRRLGSVKNTPVDVRVIAASNISLMELVHKKQFREDLYYRLCTLPIFIPPLKDRKGDIEILINQFSKNTNIIKLDPQVLRLLLMHNWPGNIRELQNVIKYISTIIVPNSLASMDELPPYLLKVDSNTSIHLSTTQSEHFFTTGIQLPETINNTETHKMLLFILKEMHMYVNTVKGVGHSSILQKIQSAFPNTSEYYVKRLLQVLRDLGYAKARKTKQGTSITPKGIQLIEQLGKSDI